MPCALLLLFSRRYYTLPILVHAGVAKVYACEWNPHAIEGLKRGLAANGVESRWVGG
jgi:tRNA G37 N-methylase Trm5